jgi:hypothetical protein
MERGVGDIVLEKQRGRFLFPDFYRYMFEKNPGTKAIVRIISPAQRSLHHQNVE